MSRSGYDDDYGDVWQSIKWGGQLKAGLMGRRGQEMLADLVRALDAMPVKELAFGTFQSQEEGVCALGCVSAARGIDVTDLNSDEPEDRYDAYETAKAIAARLNVPVAVACEVMHVNDDFDNPPWMRWNASTPMLGPTAEDVRKDRESRWRSVRAWAVAQMERAMKRGDPK